MGTPQQCDETPHTYVIICHKSRSPTPDQINILPGIGANNGLSRVFDAAYFKSLAACERTSRPVDPAKTLENALCGLLALQQENLRHPNDPASKIKINGLLALATESMTSAWNIAQNKETYASERARQENQTLMVRAVRHADEILAHVGATLAGKDFIAFQGRPSLLSGLRLIRNDLGTIGDLQRSESFALRPLEPA
jgi:hypothetical protein